MDSSGTSVWVVRYLSVAGVWAALTVSACASSAALGHGATVSRGQRVRVDYDTTVTQRVLHFIPVQHEEKRTVVGHLFSHTIDSLTILVNSRDSIFRTISVAAVTHYYVSEGLKRCTLKGLLIGAGTGAFLTLIAFGSPTERSVDETGDYYGQDRDLVRGAAFLIGGGAAVGGIVGWLVKEDRWRETKPSAWSVGVGMLGGCKKAGIRVSLAF